MVEEIYKNAVIKSQPVSTDYYAGVVEKQILCSSGQWDGYLPEVEYQKDYKTGFDSFSCVTFSALNTIEMIFLQRGERKNFADRFTAIDSGTMPDRGNSLRNVAESIRKTGVVDQAVYPFVGTEKEYFQKIPQEVRDKAYKIPVSWEWGHTGENLTKWRKDPQSVLCELLQYAPVQVTVWAYTKNIVDGIYQPHGVKDENHAVTLFGYEEGKYFKVFDHYAQSIKKLHWNYGLETPLLFTLDGQVNIAKKYAGKLFKEMNSPKVYYSNGEQIAWVKDEKSFLFGFKSGFWGYWDEINTIQEKVVEDIIF